MLFIYLLFQLFVHRFGGKSGPKCLEIKPNPPHQTFIPKRDCFSVSHDLFTDNFGCVVLKAVERINAAIRAGVAEKTVEELLNPDAQLPEVYPSASDLYQRELSSLQQQSAEVPARCTKTCTVM